jgi:hypothetical protein
MTVIFWAVMNEHFDSFFTASSRIFNHDLPFSLSKHFDGCLFRDFNTHTHFISELSHHFSWLLARISILLICYNSLVLSTFFKEKRSYYMYSAWLWQFGLHLPHFSRPFLPTVDASIDFFIPLESAWAPLWFCIQIRILVCNEKFTKLKTCDFVRKIVKKKRVFFFGNNALKSPTLPHFYNFFLSFIY